MSKEYTSEEVINATMEYFNGDEYTTSVFLKYPLRENRETDIVYHELNPADLLDRIAKEFTRIENKYPNPVYYDKIRNSIDRFKTIVPQGSPLAGIGNPYTTVSLSNCFVIESPDDSWTGISKANSNLGNLQKYRAGVGLDLSTLRPKGAKTHNGSITSTGAWSFAELYSTTTRTIGLEGRRGATMITLHVKHPDVIEFAIMKRNLSKVTGANVSLLVEDEFMLAVKEDKDWMCRFPIDVTDKDIARNINNIKWKDFITQLPPLTQNEQIINVNNFKEISGRWGFYEENGNKVYLKHYKAKDVWRVINESATMSGEPGLIFFDNYRKNLPADYYPNFKSTSTNPCLTGETLVAVADGRGTVSIKELAEQNEDVAVYCYDDTGKITIRYMRNPKMTQQNVEIYKITLDDGNIIRVTGNHKFMNTNGNYIETKDLNKGDSLKIMSRHLCTYHNNLSYWHLSGNFGNHRNNLPEHRYIAEFFNNIEITPDFVVHHKDFCSTNNTPSNLEIMTKKDHDFLHSQSKLGKNNPMYKALNGGWSTERIQQYKELQSQKNYGENNAIYSGYTHEDLKNHAIILTKQLNKRFSTQDWHNYAKLNHLPQTFSGWRKQHLNTIQSLAKWAALELNIEHIDQNPRLITTYKNLLEQGYDVWIAGNDIKIKKICEACDKEFITTYRHRQIGLCSKKCASNKATNQKDRLENTINTYKKQSLFQKTKQIEIYLDLRNKLQREPFHKEWELACKEQGVSYRLHYNSKRDSICFKTYKQLKEESKTYNHRVVAVEFDGYENVYCGAVDEYHNFFVGGWDNDNKSKQLFINNQNCAEIMLSPADSCRLLSICLKYFIKNPFTTAAEFDFEYFIDQVKLAMRLMDDLVDLEIEVVDKILSTRQEQEEIELWNKIKTAATNGRRTGLGTHGLADCLSRMCLKYDSEEAIKFSEKLYECFRNTAYSTSVELAKERGAFPDFNWEYEKTCPFIQRLPQWLQDDIKKYGRRNIAILTIAPTGSIATLSQSSSGVEPTFRNSHIRRRKINNNEAYSRVDFIDSLGDKWQEYLIFDHNVMEYLQLYPEQNKKLEEIQNNFKPTEWMDEINNILPEYFITSDKINPSMKMKLQGVIQKYICHGISNTVNLPKHTNVSIVEETYEEAWKNGLKGVTVYVDGCRSGVLVTHEDKKDSAEEIQESMAPRRKKELPCEVHRSQIDGKDWTIFVGLLNGKPYEVFGGLSEHIVLSKRTKSGKIVKRKCADEKLTISCYDFVEDEDGVIVRDIVASFKNDIYATHTRLISLQLRHGVPLQYIVEQLGKDTYQSFHSFFKVIARVLKKYVKDGAKGGEKCSQCGEKLIFIDGCTQCPSCGYTKCN